MGLGDAVERALAAAGVTEARVTRWLGAACGGCAARREKLNQLGWWAGRALRGGPDRARRLLEALLTEEDPT